MRSLHTGSTFAVDLYECLTPSERLVLWWKLRHGRRQAVRVALRSRSFRQIWSIVRLINDLVTLENEVDS